nr:unnamed protein product [Callosobruchus chinensis]
MEETIVNFQSCCRLCLCDTTDAFKNAAEDRVLPRRILDSLAIKINATDQLTTLVCEECEIMVNKWHEYKQKCVQNQSKLRRVMTKSLVQEREEQHCQSIANMSIQIKEEPLDNDENSLSNIRIKSEPVDADETMNGEYNEFPPELSPQIPDHVETEIQNGNVAYINDNERRCRYCDKIFSNISNRKKHERGMHQPNEPYARRSMCEISAKKAQEQLEQSYPSETDEKPENQPEEQHEPTEQAVEEQNEQTSENIQQTDPTEEQSEEPSAEKATEDNAEEPSSQEQPTTEAAEEAMDSSEPKDEADQQKILFAAGLKLLESNTTPISCETLSKIELSYAEKCKAMVKMHRTLECACHNVNHPNLKGLLSHLRSLRIWFPVFTCYNCMITFTDRSTFTKHNVKCPSASLDTLTKLSNLRKRSEVKVRLYQNFKCTSCKFMFSFHEDFMKHVDEEHRAASLPVPCSCEREFENMEDYKDHVYLSCLVEFYCDICFVTTDTVEEFQRHAVENHDESEGFILKQDDGYAMRKAMMQSPPKAKETVDENAIVTGKRERRPPKPIDIAASTPSSTSRTPKEKDESYVSVYDHPYSITPRSGSKACPICNKEYSSYHNMMRHFKSHSEEEISKYENESVYACPDCEEMFRLPEWRQHLVTKHQPTACEECGRAFQFRTELDQHRSVHLNIKVYRDSKTHSLKTAMISPGSEVMMLLCEICEETFHSKEDLKLHKLTHFQNLQNGGIKSEPMEHEESQKTWTCTPCDKTYHTYSGLWDHNRRKHTGEEKSIASSEYPKQCKMMMYSQGRRGETPPHEETYHSCPHCSKVFGAKSSLKNHMKTHMQGYTCGVCKDVFSTTEALLQHNMMEHPGDAMSLLETEIKQEPDDELIEPYMVYTCDVCVATFETRVELMRPSTASKNVFCKYCKISFDSVMNLAKHMHLEHGESSKPKAVKIKETNPGRRFVCTICSKAFHTQNALLLETYPDRPQSASKARRLSDVTRAAGNSPTTRLYKCTSWRSTGAPIASSWCPDARRATRTSSPRRSTRNTSDSTSSWTGRNRPSNMRFNNSSSKSCRCIIRPGRTSLANTATLGSVDLTRWVST